jgi:hypothetical protein
MTGKLAKVKKIGQTLRRGVRYYRFVLNLTIFDNFRFFRFIEFMLYSLFDYVGFRNYYFVNGKKNDSYFVVKNISGFTNLRFSDNFYLSGMPNDLIINFVKLNLENYFDTPYFFLSIFKLV